MKAFGPPHASPDIPTCPVPIGEKCLYCDEVFVEGDEGFLVPYDMAIGTREVGQHRECFFRSIFGSVGHMKKTCPCYGGTEEDPPGMSRRQAALAACEFDETLRRANGNVGK